MKKFLNDRVLSFWVKPKSIGRTGIEMEMLTAVSVAALEIYDMLKPVDKQLEISNIKTFREARRQKRQAIALC